MCRPLPNHGSITVRQRSSRVAYEAFVEQQDATAAGYQNRTVVTPRTDANPLPVSAIEMGFGKACSFPIYDRFRESRARQATANIVTYFPKTRRTATYP